MFTGGFISREEQIPWSVAEGAHVLPKVSLQTLEANRGEACPMENYIYFKSGWDFPRKMAEGLERS